MADDLYLNPHNTEYSETSTSCDGCQNANLLCDGSHPCCSSCAQFGLVCSYNQRISRRRVNSQPNLHCNIPERQTLQLSQNSSQFPSPSGNFAISDLVPRITISSTSEQYLGQSGFENRPSDMSYFYSSPSPTYHSPMPSSPVSPYGSINFYQTDNLQPHESRENPCYASPILNASPNNSFTAIPILTMPEVAQRFSPVPSLPQNTIPQMSQDQGNAFNFPNFVKFQFSQQEKQTILYYFRHVHALIPVVDIIQFQTDFGWEGERHSPLGTLIGAMVGLSEQHMASPEKFSKSAALFLTQVNLDAYFPSNQSHLGPGSRSHNASASYLLDQLNSFHFAHDCT
ncbi:DNA-binding transcription factor cat8 [Entomophthora muscae]|uniref:DNA-binding transcription factor cat8 n=1 Tax=Entomophthora muscae TaxID=34485 RepID=A0ACC2UMV0_9FUNG|nr:DNA-binding transcription factor cat8 [Entomophthora muscae]